VGDERRCCLRERVIVVGDERRCCLRERVVVVGDERRCCLGERVDVVGDERQRCFVGVEKTLRRAVRRPFLFGPLPYLTIYNGEKKTIHFMLLGEPFKRHCPC